MRHARAASRAATQEPPRPIRLPTPEAAPDPRMPLEAARPSQILALQASAGNRAVARMIDRACDCGDGCCAQAPGGPAPDAARPEVESLAAHAAASASPEELTVLADRMDAAMEAPETDVTAQPAQGVATLARLPAAAGRAAQRVAGQRGGRGAFCTPYEWWELPQAARDKAFLIATLPGVSTAMFGTTEVGAIWLQFLAGGAPARRSYATPGNAIVEGFRNAAVTGAAHGQVLDEAEAAIAASPPAIPETGELEVPVASLGLRLDRAIDWSNPYDIPGHLAGGQSGGAGGPDTRTLEGSVRLSRLTGLDGSTSILMRSDIGFAVNDTVDFCPGGAGSGLEQALTVPLSRLEATGEVWASDVPFDVRFKPPTATRTIAAGSAWPETDAGRGAGEVRSRGGDRSRGREDGVRREDQETRRVD